MKKLVGTMVNQMRNSPVANAATADFVNALSESNEVGSALEDVHNMALGVTEAMALSDLNNPEGVTNQSFNAKTLMVEVPFVQVENADGKVETVRKPEAMASLVAIGEQLSHLADIAKSSINKEILSSAALEYADSELAKNGCGTLSPITSSIVRRVAPFVLADSSNFNLAAKNADLSLHEIKSAAGIGGSAQSVSNFTVDNSGNMGYLPAQLIQQLYPWTVAYYIEKEYMTPCVYRDKLLTVITDATGEISKSTRIKEIMELLAMDVTVSNGPADKNTWTHFKPTYGESREMAISEFMMHTGALAISAEELSSVLIRTAFITTLVRAINLLTGYAESAISNKFHNQIPTTVIANGKAREEAQLQLSGIDSKGHPNNSLYIRDLRLALETSRQHFAGFKASIITGHPLALGIIFDSFFIKDQGYVPNFGTASDMLGDTRWDGQNQPMNTLASLDPNINYGLKGGGISPGMDNPTMEQLNAGRFNVGVNTRKRSLLQMTAVLWEKHYIEVGTHIIEVMPDRNHKFYDIDDNYADATSVVLDSQEMLTLGESFATDLHIYDHTRVGILVTSGIRHLTGDVQTWHQNSNIMVTAFELKESAFLYPNAMRLSMQNIRVASAYNKEFVNVRFVNIT